MSPPRPSPARRSGVVAVAALLAALAALVAGQTHSGLRHVDRMMAERSTTLHRMVATEVTNVARFGMSRLERLDQVLAEIADSPDVDGVLLERDDGQVRLAHGTLPAPVRLAALAPGRVLDGATLLVSGPVRIETHHCGEGPGGPAECPQHGGAALDGDYRVVLALDARPYQQLGRSVWRQGLAGGALVVALGIGLWLLDRQSRRAFAMRQALALADERTRSVERLGLVAAGLAHEVKNPIGSLRGFAQLIAEKAAPGSPEAEYAGLMLGELDGITRRMDGLRHFARPAPAALAPGRPAEVVRRVTALLAPDFAARELELELELPAGEGPEALVDADRLRDLVVNLVMNAVEASPRGGTVVVRLRFDEAAGAFTLEVADQGPGIPEEARERALRPFHTTKPGGLGLGLALAQRAVEDHGGTLQLDATAGGGALVRARWPRRRPDAR